jgi:hypothetical protein
MRCCSPPRSARPRAGAATTLPPYMTLMYAPYAALAVRSPTSPRLPRCTTSCSRSFARTRLAALRVCKGGVRVVGWGAQGSGSAARS